MLFVDTLWTLFGEFFVNSFVECFVQRFWRVFVDSCWGHLLWILIADTFCGQFLWTLLLNLFEYAFWWTLFFYAVLWRLTPPPPLFTSAEVNNSHNKEFFLATFADPSPPFLYLLVSD